MRTKLLMIALFVSLSFAAVAQSPYRTAAGLFIDVGDGRTLVGPHIKHFYSPNDAIAGSLLFAGNHTYISGEYSYNKSLEGARGLYWNVGVGPQIAFGKNRTSLAIRPAVGLEFKVPTAPLAFGFDWRPWWTVTDGSHFTPGRFGLSFKYTFSAN